MRTRTLLLICLLIAAILPAAAAPRTAMGQGVSIQVDNQDSGFTTGGGTWWSAPIGINGSMNWTCTNGSTVDAWGQWRTTIPTAGDYTVEVYVPNYNTNTTNAPYTVSYSGGSKNILIRQQDYYDQWVPLGTFSYNAGATASVRLTDATGETYVGPPAANPCGPRIGFDAVRWTLGGSGGGGGGGGGNSTPKPTILSRDVWHAREPVKATVTQTPTHIVIHHTVTRKQDSSRKELEIAKFLRSDATKHNAIDILDIYGEKHGMGNYSYSSIRDEWAGIIWLIQQDHILKEDYQDVGYHYFIDPEGVIYEGRKGRELIKGEAVEAANKDAIHIAFLGDFEGGSPFHPLPDSPSGSAIQSGEKLIRWLLDEYDIDPLGKFLLPKEVLGQPSCNYLLWMITPNHEGCLIDTIAGHRDFFPKTGKGFTVCPGRNLYSLLPYFRAVNQIAGSPSSTTMQTASSTENPTGLLIGLFSPAVSGVVDPAGRRLGVDPTTGTYVNDIPGGLFGYEDPDETDAPFWLEIPSSIDGIYHVSVLGTGTGDFTIGVMDIQTSNVMFLEGTTTPGEVDNFQIINSTQHPGEFELWQDNAPPATTLRLDGTQGRDDWFTSDVTVNLAASDLPATGASGVERTEYSLDGSATWQTYSQPFVLTNGVHTLGYRSVDRVGNVEQTQSATIKVDTIAPTTSIRLAGTLGLNDWYTSTVQITLDAQDNAGGSGVGSVEWSDDSGATWQPYAAPFSDEKEGIITLLTRVGDVAGNIETPPAQITFKADRTPPVVAVSTDKPQYTRLETIVVSYSAYDPQPGSGLNTVEARFGDMPLSDGARIDPFWFNLDSYAITATASDYAGWRTTKTATFELIATLESLRATIVRLRELGEIDGDGTTKSLLAKVDAAIASKDRGNLQAVWNQLGALLKEVEAQSGKHITSRAATVLLSDARYVQNHLR